MPRDCHYSPKTHTNTDVNPFNNAEEAWFWFINAQEAKNSGARVTAGQSLTPRPCEPTDILKILDRLYRNRRLTRDHLLVLRHYGRRQLAPDLNHIKEVRAHGLWAEAMERIEPVLISKEIVSGSTFDRMTLKCPNPNRFWRHGAVVHHG